MIDDEKCKFCGKELNPTHSCRTMRSHIQYAEFEPVIKMLIDDGYSILSIVKSSVDRFGVFIPYHYIQKACQWLNVSPPTLSEAAKSKRTRDKYKKTVESIYGVGITNVSQSSVVKKRKNETNMERYGVNNQFQREEVKDKTKKTMIEKYGVEHPIQMPSRSGMPGKITKPHKLISDYLNELGVEHINEATGKFKKFNAVLNREYCPIPDIYVPSANLVIEIYGDRWHMNPNTFHPTDIIHFFAGDKSAEQIWAADANRIEHIQSFGVDVEVIWCYNIKHNLDAVKHTLKEKLCSK